MPSAPVGIRDYPLPIGSDVQVLLKFTESPVAGDRLHDSEVALGEAA